MDICEECGFEYDPATVDTATERIRRAASEIGHLLTTEPAHSALRPSPQRWSALEYAAHVRDVLITIRDRSIVAIVEDTPEFKPMYRDERIAFGLYAGETAEQLARELPAAAEMMSRFFDAYTDEQRSRTLVWGYPSPAVRTVGWTALQGTHETLHHLRDVQENLRSA